MSPNWVPLFLYAAAGCAYAVMFARLSPDSRRDAGAPPAATLLLAAGALTHTFVIGMQTTAAGHVPFARAPQATSMFVWLLALAYLYTEVTAGERAMGSFITPLLVGLQLIPVLQPGVEPRATVLESPLLGLHVSALLFAYAGFALAFVIGLTYVLLFNEIKAKHLGFFYARLPSLQKLDDMNRRAVTIGWLFLTAGIVVGVIWVAVIPTAQRSDPRVVAMSIGDAKILVTVICWGLYSFQLYARRALSGWSGRRSAWLSTIGFVIVLLNFVPVSYFLTKSHDF